jgi:hypothetical protein
MTAELKLKIIEAITDAFFDQQCETRLCPGTLSAINAVLKMDDDEPETEPKNFIEYLHDIFFNDNVQQ